MKASGCYEARESKVVANPFEFLKLLSPHHLYDLAAQCDLKVRDIEDDKTPAVHGIIDHLKNKKGGPLRLRGKGKGENLSWKFEEGTSYVLGLNTPYLRPVKSKAATKLEFELPDNPLLEILFFNPFLTNDPRIIIFPNPCLFMWYGWIVPGVVLEGPWTFEEGSTIITDEAYLRFADSLTMKEGAKLYGQHRCGFRLEINHLIGQHVATNERPVISTSIEGIEANLLADSALFERVPAATTGTEDIYVYKLLGESLPTNIEGDTGPVGPDANPDTIRGEDDANPAECVAFAPYVPPENGESVGHGMIGGTGGKGQRGYSPRQLDIRFGMLSGNAKFLFDASGGKGGKGGIGGKGQSVEGGAGGDISWVCFNPLEDREPGQGGSTGEAGDGGDGGTGGNGGRGGTIKLTYEPDTNEGLFSARVKGGEGGDGGNGGTNGTSRDGRNGRWTDFWGNPIEEERSSRLPPVPGLGASGASGRRGLNGRIWVNGEWVVSGGNRSDVGGEYCYPNPGSGEC